MENDYTKQFDEIWGIQSSPNNPTSPNREAISNRLKELNQIERDNRTKYQNVSNDIGDLGAGIVKGAGQLVQGTGNLLARGVYALEKPIVSGAVKAFSGGKKEVDPNLTVSDLARQATEAIPSETLQTTNAAEKAGKTVFDVASIFAQPEVSLEKLGVSGLSHLAEVGALSLDTVKRLAPVIESKFGMATLRGLENMAQGSAYGAVSAAGRGEDNVGKEALTAGITNVAAQPIASFLGNKAGEIVDTLKQKSIVDIGKDVIKKIPTTEERNFKAALEAVNPELRGKKLSEAYKDVVTGKRTASPATLTKSQEISESEQAAELANRLKDTLVHKDPLKNLNALGKELTTTEERLNQALTGHPDLQYLGNKPELNQKLFDVKNRIPREFKAIKESQNAYDNVVDFADELLQEADDSILGLRDARIKFDMQAKKEFPSVFKDGFIDTKTPAGRAIKEVRDTINDHLYETAPNGSEIKDLVQKEADIFRARDIIAQDAAKMHGLSKLKRFMQKNPYASKVIGGILTGSIVGGGIVGTVNAFKE